MRELRWRIYYEDGSTYSNLDGPFREAPSDGVLGVVERDEQVGYQIFRGKDFYFELEDGSIGETDDLGPLLRKLKLVKFGIWTGKHNWSSTWDRMVNESRRDFPRKSGKGPVEDG